jgi:hypothetical protein
MAIIIAVSDERIIAEPNLQWLILSPEFLEFGRQIGRVADDARGIKVQKTDDTVFLIGFDNGDIVLLVPYEVWQREIHFRIIQYGFTGGHPLFYFLAFFGCYFSRQKPGIKDGSENDAYSQKSQKHSPVQPEVCHETDL